jgi:hypothetical protein
MKFSKDFKKNLAHMDMAPLNASMNTIFFLDSQLIIRGYNDYYVHFATQNGLLDIESKFGLDCPVLEAISPELRSYYEQSWQKTLLANRVFTQEYECSSPEQIRRYYQTAYPIYGGTGLIVISTCMFTLENDSDEVAVMPQHTRPDGFVVQCSNCRKVKNHDFEEQWDWIPQWVGNPPSNTSHGICAYCIDHYYPDLSL